MPSTEEQLAWLGEDRSLEELQDRFPADWARVRERLIAAGEAGRPGVDRLLAELTPLRSGDRAPTREAQLRRTVERRMVRLTLASWSDRTESGVEEGRIAFRRFDAAILQRVLFSEGLVRKPVRMLPFRIAWRLAKQRDRLLPIMRQQGVWCFYSRPLLREIARIAAGRAVLEIGAGDGTLTRMLRDIGVAAVAADDHSWSHRITYPSWVEKADAVAALRAHPSPVVVCSWPPAGNGFERHVFADPQVEVYIAIVSADPREAGASEAYGAQTGFEVEARPDLDALVLPTGRNRVLVFRRR